MANTINGDTSNGLQLSSDASGVVELQADGTTKVTVDSSGATVVGTLAATAVTGDGSGLTNVNTPTYVKMARVTAQTFTTSVTQQINYDQVDYDSHTLTNGDGTFTVTAATAGIWVVEAKLKLASSPTRGIIQIKVGSNSIAEGEFSNSTEQSFTAGTIINLSDGDVISSTLIQLSGSNISTKVNNYGTQLIAYKL